MLRLHSLSIAIVNHICWKSWFSGLVGDEKRIILQEHNRLRQSVATGNVLGQPSAENMREIVWDDELAAKAQEWANNCQFRHDPKRTINRFTMGQNLAIIWSTAPLADDDGDFPSRIQAWFNEVRKYSFGDPWAPYTGHYSQLVWGDTDLVGCGFAYYKDKSKYNKLYVCNYGPGGNVVGEKPYEVGKPSCHNHGLKPSSKYHGLCATEQVKGGPGVLRNSIDNTYGYRQNDFITKTSFSSTSFYTNVYNNNNNKQVQQSSEQQQQQPQPQRVPVRTLYSLPSTTSTTTTTTTTPSPPTTTAAPRVPPPTPKYYNSFTYYLSPVSTPAAPNSIFATAGVDRPVFKPFVNPVVVPQRPSWTIHTQTQKPQILSTTTTTTSTPPPPPQPTEQPTRRTGWSLLTWRG
ncbi:crispld1 family protein [Megaselia abdita]